MDIEATDPNTGKTVKMSCVASSESDIRDLMSFELSEETLKKRLDGLDISADAKSILFTIAKMTIKVGSAIVRIGRKIIELVIGFLKEFPMTTMATLFGLVFGILLSSVPIIGFVLGPIVTKLSVAMGFAMGGMQDFNNRAMAAKVEATIASFDGLKPQV